MVEVVNVRDLSVVQTFEVPGSVLDVAFHRDVMYISIDSSEKALILEYRHTSTGFEKVSSKRWNFSDSLECGPKVELYWLESMRKALGHSDDD